MKKILVLVVMACFIGHVNASVDPKSPVGMSVVKSGDVCKLYYRGEEGAEKVEVTIYNEDGGLVFREVMRNIDNFMRPYDFSMLPEGQYTIALNDGERTRVEKVAHFKPVKNHRVVNLVRVNKGENKYMLGVHTEGSDILTIRIFDENRNLLFTSTESVNGDVAKCFNLKGVKGRHFFEVSDQQGRVIRLSRPSVKESLSRRTM